jgi:hypothetical protein
VLTAEPTGEVVYKLRRLVLKVQGHTAIVTASGPRGQAIVELIRKGLEGRGKG